MNNNKKDGICLTFEEKKAQELEKYPFLANCTLYERNCLEIKQLTKGKNRCTELSCKTCGWRKK